jgi:S1-C subfamily serine protease
MNTRSLWFAPLVGIVSIVFGYFLAARFLPALTSTPTASVVSSLETVVAQTSSAVVSVRTDIANLADPEMRGAGTAFHIGDGYFVTAAHVVDGGSKIYLDNRPRTVQHLENTEVATLVGKVDGLDLALLRGNPLPTKLEWASQASNPGAPCLAIGNPFARAPRSVTVGVISGVDRLQVTPKGALAGLVQFDAQVNPGNSGGALLNASGQVLGVVSSILSPTGSSAGVGFAISTAQVRPAIEALQRGQAYTLRSLGATSRENSATLQAVLPGGLAVGAGLQVGDTLLEVGGLATDTLPEANAVVAAAQAGSSLPVLLKRAGKLQKLEVQIR